MKKINDLDYKLLKEKYKDNIDYALKKIDENYPIQYLIGYVDFYGYHINVDERVLIPRYETEYLLEKTINYIHKYNLENSNVLDIGTGSGCIDIVLKKNINSLNIDTIDISSAALDLAKENYKINDVSINTINCDIKKYKTNKKYSIIISNPPYVSFNEVVGPEIKYEPKNAIYASENGLEYYNYILNNISNNLTNNYFIAMEIGYNQGKYLYDLSKNIFKDAKVAIENDLSKRDRYLFIIK